MSNAAQIGSIAGLVIAAAVATAFGAPYAGIALASSASRRKKDELSPDPRLGVDDADIFRVVNEVRGSKFRLGGKGTWMGFDCAGLVEYTLMHTKGISLPRTPEGHIDLSPGRYKASWARRPCGISWLTLVRPLDLIFWHDTQAEADL